MVSAHMRACLSGLALLAASPASAEIAIGVAGPMSGPFQIFGAQMMAGAEQAVTDINAAGGLLGEQLVLEVADDRCERKDAEAVANQMVGRGVALVVGHLCSGASLMASPVYQRAGIIEISPGARAPEYTDARPGPNIFRLAGREDRQGEVAGQFLADKFSGSRIAILHDGSPYGSKLAEAVRLAMNAAGKQEIFYDDFRPNEADYGSLVTRLDLERVDVSFVGGTHTDAARIIRQAHDSGLALRLVSGDALMTEGFVEAAGPAADGALMTYPPDPARTPGAQAVVAEFAKRDIIAEAYVLPAYAAVQLWAKAVEQAGSKDSAAVAKALSEGSFDSVLGRVSFDTRGDASLPAYVIYEWRNGEYDYAPM